MPNPFDLARFVDAQHGTFDQALQELNAAHKLQHPLLGERLRVCTAAVNGVRGRTASQVFGSPDDMKFCFSMTLFDLADPAQPTFRQALERYYGGVQDPLTLALLAGTRP